MKRLVSNDNKEKAYLVFSKQDQAKNEKRLKDKLASCKMSLEETIKLDDDMNTGFVTYEGIKESFEIMDLELEPDLEEYILYYIFKHSTSVEKLKYMSLIELLDEIDDDFDEPAQPSEHESDKKSEKISEPKPEKISKKDTSEMYEEEFDNDEPQVKKEETKDSYIDDFNDPVESVKESVKHS